MTDRKLRLLRSQFVRSASEKKSKFQDALDKARENSQSKIREVLTRGQSFRSKFLNKPINERRTNYV